MWINVFHRKQSKCHFLLLIQHDASAIIKSFTKIVWVFDEKVRSFHIGTVFFSDWHSIRPRVKFQRQWTDFNPLLIVFFLLRNLYCRSVTDHFSSFFFGTEIEFFKWNARHWHRFICFISQNYLFRYTTQFVMYKKAFHSIYYYYLYINDKKIIFFSRTISRIQHVQRSSQSFCLFWWQLELARVRGCQQRVYVGWALCWWIKPEYSLFGVFKRICWYRE